MCSLLEFQFVGLTLTKIISDFQTAKNFRKGKKLIIILCSKPTVIAFKPFFFKLSDFFENSNGFWGKARAAVLRHDEYLECTWGLPQFYFGWSDWVMMQD